MLLWTATDDTHANDVLVVPRTHAFNCPFPGTYQHKDSAGFIQTWRLPPTHDIILQNHGKAVGRSRLSYAIHVVVTKQRPGMIRVTRSMSKTQRFGSVFFVVRTVILILLVQSSNSHYLCSTPAPEPSHPQKPKLIWYSQTLA